MILALLSSSWTHNKLYSMLLAGIFPAKYTQQKLVESSETSSSMIHQTHENPFQTHKYFPAGFQQENAKSYGDVTLVNIVRNCHYVENPRRKLA